MVSSLFRAPYVRLIKASSALATWCAPSGHDAHITSSDDTISQTFTPQFFCINPAQYQIDVLCCRRTP